MVEGKVLIVDMREITARGIWKSAEQTEKVVNRPCPADWTGPWKERAGEREMKTKRARAKETEREGAKRGRQKK